VALHHELPPAILEKRKQMEPVASSCPHCGAYSILAEAVGSSDGPYFVYECIACNTAWKNTWVSVLERLLAAKLLNERE
jgi:hypothetical protein